jgi:hypothetical protein
MVSGAVCACERRRHDGTAAAATTSIRDWQGRGGSCACLFCFLVFSSRVEASASARCTAKGRRGVQPRPRCTAKVGPIKRGPARRPGTRVARPAAKRRPRGGGRSRLSPWDTGIKARPRRGWGRGAAHGAARSRGVRGQAVAGARGRARGAARAQAGRRARGAHTRRAAQNAGARPWRGRARGENMPCGGIGDASIGGPQA